METPFWEETYKNNDVSTFGMKPNATILEFEHLYKKSWSVIDIGCGEGQNALYLPSKGFSNVDAFDLSENAIAKVRHLAEKDGIKINAWVQDLRKFSFKKQYDLVISFGTLHFVEKTDWKYLLKNAKDNTNIGGIHIIQLFTNVLPASPDIAAFAIGLADDEEIKSVYDDWNILQFKSYTFEDEHPGVPKHFHASNKIVVQRTV